MYNVNLLGMVVNSVYLSGFIYYTPDHLRGNIYRALGKCMIFLAAVLAYTTIENQDAIEFRYGMILTGFLVVLVGMPLLEVPQIFRKQCTEGMPFPTILSGFAVSAAWMLYGFATRNAVFIVSIGQFFSEIILKLCLQVQNGVIALIVGFQLSLFAIFPNTPAAAVSGNLKKEN